MTESPLFVLLASYEGARFLPAQLASIAAQTDPDWRLLVRDDGSRDGTREILEDAAARDDRIHLVRDDRGRLGSSASFHALMELARDAGAQRFALCDQDDVWVPTRLQRMRETLTRIGDGPDGPLPALVYSDLAWIDADGRRLAASHFRRAGLATALAGPELWLLAMNAVPGCAMVGNRALLELALPAPAGIVHHDWWLAAVAAAAGRVGVIDAALVEYRQHGGNVVGAQSLAARVTDAAAAPHIALRRGAAVYWQAVAQSRALLERLPPGRMNPGWHDACTHVVGALGAASPLQRMRAVLRGPVRRPGVLRALLMFAAAVSPRDSLIE